MSNASGFYCQLVLQGHQGNTEFHDVQRAQHPTLQQH